MGVEKVIRATTKVKKKDRGLVRLALVAVCLVALAVIVPAITSFMQFVLNTYFPPKPISPQIFYSQEYHPEQSALFDSHNP